jgi:Tetratricopeptide repeat
VQVIETSLRVLREEHPSTLTSIAKELFVQVMETRKRVLGKEHPDTLTSMNNLAFTLKRRGQDAEAIKLMEKCVQLQTLVLGADHPHTLSSSAVLIAWQTKRLEIDASAAKVPGNNNMFSQTD